MVKLNNQDRTSETSGIVYFIESRNNKNVGNKTDANKVFYIEAGTPKKRSVMSLPNLSPSKLDLDDSRQNSPLNTDNIKSLMFATRPITPLRPVPKLPRLFETEENIKLPEIRNKYAVVPTEQELAFEPQPQKRPEPEPTKSAPLPRKEQPKTPKNILPSLMHRKTSDLTINSFHKSMSKYRF